MKNKMNKRGNQISRVVLSLIIMGFAVDTLNASEIDLETQNKLESKVLASEMLTCKLGLLNASKKMDDENAGPQLGEVKEMKSPVDDFNGGEVNYQTPSGQNILAFMSADTTENVTGLYHLQYGVKVDGKRELMSSVLLKYDSISSGGGWDFGPKGSKLLKLLFPDSFSEKPIELVLTNSAFKVLKKYGVERYKENANTYELFKVIAEATKNGDLREGDFIGTAIFLGCYID